MAYDVTKSNTERLAIVNDRTVETSSSSIGLIGKNYTNHGEIIAENLVHMLENFNKPIEPENPIIGQLWWQRDVNNNIETDVENLNVYTGSADKWQRMNPNLTKIDTIKVVPDEEVRTAIYKISESDHGNYLRIDSTKKQTVLLSNTASIPVGTSVIIVRVGTGDVVISAEDGAVAEPQNLPKMIANRFGRVTAIKVMQLNGVATWEIDATADKLSSETWNITASPATVNEGAPVTWTITSNALPGTYFWSIEQIGGISGADFVDNAMSGTFTLANGIGTITKTLRSDSLTEGSETIILNIAKTQNGVSVVSSTVLVNDTSRAPDDGTSEPTPTPAYNPSINLQDSFGGTGTVTINWTIVNGPANGTYYYEFTDAAEIYSSGNGNLNSSGGATISTGLGQPEMPSTGFNLRVTLSLANVVTNELSDRISYIEDDGSVNNDTSAVMLANYFWINRSSLVRYGTSGDIYPGDNYSVNNPNARFVGSFRNSWIYANSVLPGSTHFTVISLATGAIGNGITATSVDGGILIPGSDLTVYYIGDNINPTPNNGNGYGISYNVKVYQGSIDKITSNSIVSNHMTGNRGAWTYSYILPQKWQFVSPVVNFNENYTATLNPGDVHFTLIERGGDGASPIVQPNGISNNITVDNWWYNGGGVQCSVNTSSSPIELSYPLTVTSSPVGDTGNIIETSTSPFAGWTPRIAGILKKLD